MRGVALRAVLAGTLCVAPLLAFSQPALAQVAPAVATPPPDLSAAAVPPAAPPKTAKPVALPPPEPKISQYSMPSFHAESGSMLIRAAEAYSALAARGGWPTVPLNAILKPGQSDPAVPIIRQRLAAEGDFAGPLTGDMLDPALVAGVKRFQLRHGLSETGIVGPATVKAMNVPVQDRLRQLVFSQQRLAASTFAFGQRHVIVNIPSAAVEAVENGAVARRYVAIVGDPEHPSPTVEARIGAINFNPNWTVPTSIIRKEIIPKMRRDPTYLAKSRIRMLDAAGQEVDPTAIDWSGNAAVNYTLRQDPGTANSLGLVRIAMPNRESVYMHDTPSKRFFARDLRFLSHGCVRVSGVLDLVAWLLAPQGWTREVVDMAIASAARKDVRIPQPVPVAWVYATGFVTQDGLVHFRDDIYGLDRQLPVEPEVTATIAR